MIPYSTDSKTHLSPTPYILTSPLKSGSVANHNLTDVFFFFLSATYDFGAFYNQLCLRLKEMRC